MLLVLKVPGNANLVVSFFGGSSTRNPGGSSLSLCVRASERGRTASGRELVSVLRGLLGIHNSSQLLAVKAKGKRQAFSRAILAFKGGLIFGVRPGNTK